MKFAWLKSNAVSNHTPSQLNAAESYDHFDLSKQAYHLLRLISLISGHLLLSRCPVFSYALAHFKPVTPEPPTGSQALNSRSAPDLNHFVSVFL
jgi:hypothetical protein